MPHSLGDAIDQIVTIPMRVGIASVATEKQLHLYDQARARQGNVALTMLAAQQLVYRVAEGDWVFLLTGYGETPWFPAGEMDGPPGVACLARALSYGASARCLYLAEPATVPTVVASSRAAGVPIYDAGVIEQFNIRRSGAAIDVPLGEQAARERAIALLDRFQPKALIACEKLGPNAQGEFVPVDGHQLPTNTVDCVAPFLFEHAQKRGILTIGIGDMGNELGLGLVEDVANAYSGPNPPNRYGGSGSGVKSDITVLATISNWGAYGVAACLAYLFKNPDCLYDEQIEGQVLAGCAAEGSVDFGAGVPINHVDGLELVVHQAVITLLRTVIRGRLHDRGRSFFPDEFTELARAWQQPRPKNGI